MKRPAEAPEKQTDMDSLRRLEEIFGRFPGIGPRQARRFIYHILSRPDSSIREFTDLVHEVKKTAAECGMCHRFFIGKNVAAVCPICSDGSRDNSFLMIVARDSDFESIEKSGAYNGLYFILGGTVPVLDKEPEKRIRLETLLARLAEKDSPVKEIVLSLSTTPDGENTAEVAGRAIRKASDARITVMGRGLSTGAELEYADGDTIRNAFLNRR